MRRLCMVVMAIVALACTGRPAAATANYEYRPDEYVTIEQGQAPDRRHALATHGEGEFGDGNFHVWLMRDGRRIGALPGIDEHNNLDTAASAYKAYWAPDSRHVAVSWRVNRHIVQLNLYAVEGVRATLIEMPDLFTEVTGRVLRGDDDLRTGVPVLAWSNRSRFVIKEYRLFAAIKGDGPALLHAFGRFGQLDDRQPQADRTFIVLVVEAEYTLPPSRRPRLINLKPGDLAWWRRPDTDPR